MAFPWFKRAKTGLGPDEVRVIASEVLQEVLKDQEKRIDQLEMEWEDWFEKFRNLYGRINKRRQREVSEGESEGPPVATPPISPLAAALLSQGRES